MVVTDQLIVALDVSTSAEAQRIVQAVGPSASIFKVGKQLFTAEGPQVVRDLVGSGRKVFLDLKFHDIPNTVGAAAKAAAQLNVTMFTVHAAGGAAMLRAAVEGAAGGPQVLAVTVLTSFVDEDLHQIGVSGRVIDQALRLAQLAKLNGCSGIISSPKEVRQLRQALGTGFTIVTPGVRPAGSAAGDQARVDTPQAAIAAGADYVVVGRPITAAPDPGAAARAIAEQIAGAAEPVSRF
ncbi:MAG: orotidine-5'-phosphate decarboxylase [Acidobacteria bacterium]|nr:orotidine-5'-phosphate decarboxylase [Acidobacteriaceae bacterium]MBV9610109.1 orotidine-5'-phosphate decarboxylase [Acidobacteriota bacterium]